MADLTTVTSYGRAGASARVRVFEWLDWFGLESRAQATYLGTRNNSPSTLMRNLGGVLTAELRLRKLARTVASDSLLLSRQASPFSIGGIESRLLSSASRGVYDFDDALFLHPVGTNRLFPKHRIWRRSVAAADVVIAGNDMLAQRAAEISNSVTVIPSCVDPNQYTTKVDYELCDHPIAVWIGSPSTESYLSQIAPALLQVHRSRGLRLRVISAGKATLGALDAMIDRVDWASDTFTSLLATADMGIMPLYDSEWARGKCAYKLLQYGAAALPMIASPVGVNRCVLHQANGIAAETLDDWVQALEQMIDESSTQRALRGVRGRDSVSRHYSFEAWATVWLDAVGLSLPSP